MLSKTKLLAVSLGLVMLYALGFGFRSAAHSQCVPVPSGLVGWWPGDGDGKDVSGGNLGLAHDQVGIAPGKVGPAFNLENGNSSVFVPANRRLDVGTGSGFTVELWIKPTDVRSEHPLVEWNDGTSLGVHFWIYKEPGQLFVNLVDRGGNDHKLFSEPGVVVANVFQHVALTYDRHSGRVTIYRNGVAVAEGNMGPARLQTRYNLYFGERPVTGAYATVFYLGLMDEISLYKRALTASEIRGIFNAGSNGKCADVPNLSISGSVKDATGAPLADIQMAGSGNMTDFTDDTGSYTFNNLRPGTYSVAPLADDYTFVPLSGTLSLQPASPSRLDFIALKAPFVSGRVIDGNGRGVAAVNILLDQGTATVAKAVTNASGYYWFSSVLPGTYTMTPSFNNYVFKPLHMTVAVKNTSKLAEMDFGVQDAP